MQDKKLDFEGRYAELKLICETVRMSALQTINARRTRKDRITDVKHLFEFPWEKQRSVAQTPEQMKMFMKAFAKVWNGRAKNGKQVVPRIANRGKENVKNG